MPLGVRITFEMSEASTETRAWPYGHCEAATQQPIANASSTAATIAVRRDGERVPMATIADEAGVGVGTLYRHYPRRGRPSWRL